MRRAYISLAARSAPIFCGGAAVCSAAVWVIGIADIEAINYEILNTQELLKIANPEEDKFQFFALSKHLNEVVDARVFFAQLSFIMSAAAGTFLTIAAVTGYREQKTENNCPTVSLIIGGSVFAINTAAVITGEILLNSMFLDQVKEGLLTDHSFFNSVVLSPILPGLAVTVLGVVTAALLSLIIGDKEIGADQVQR